MIKPELGPFDWDLVHMIKNLIGKEVNVVESQKNHAESFAIYWERPEDKKMHKAILDSIKGRASERYIKTDPGKINVTYIKYDPETWPTQHRYDLTEPDETFGDCYIRKVRAMKYVRNCFDLLIDFVGGGTHTIPKTKGLSQFEFPDENGLMLKVMEGDYVVWENGSFSVIKAKEFESQFKQQKTKIG